MPDGAERPKRNYLATVKVQALLASSEMARCGATSIILRYLSLQATAESGDRPGGGSMSPQPMSRGVPRYIDTHAMLAWRSGNIGG